MSRDVRNKRLNAPLSNNFAPFDFLFFCNFSHPFTCLFHNMATFCDSPLLLRIACSFYYFRLFPEVAHKIRTVTYFQYFQTRANSVSIYALLMSYMFGV